MTGRHCLTVYVREGCHLCEALLQGLSRLRGELDFDMRIVDIDRDAALRDEFNDQIPVVALGGRVLSRHFLDAMAVSEALTHG